MFQQNEHSYNIISLILSEEHNQPTNKGDKHLEICLAFSLFTFHLSSQMFFY